MNMRKFHIAGQAGAPESDGRGLLIVFLAVLGSLLYWRELYKNSLSASEHTLKGLFLPSSRGPRKEIAQLQQSFALLAVRRKFLEFYCDLFFFVPADAWVLEARRRAKFRQVQRPNEDGFG
jgi:hypothetical protein